MKILVTRHGETDWNVQNLVQGATDNPLNEKGIEQARETGRRLKDRKIDRIYSSDLIRARQTSENLADELDEKPPILYTPALREQNFGIFEGRNRDDEEYQKEKNLYFKPFENGESFLDVAARVYPFLDELIRNGKEDETVLLSCHGGICRMIASYFTDLGNEEFVRYFEENCNVREYDSSMHQSRQPD